MAHTGNPEREGEHPLRHVLVAGGRPAEWAALSPEQWRVRLDELGKVADHAGATWLTLRPFGPDGPGAAAAVPTAAPGRAGAGVGVRTAVAGGCTVVTSPGSDGRQRLVAAMRAAHAAGEPVTEATIAARLNAPANADPDLVLVLGPPDRLPPSLVWELAYSELVFVDAAWTQFQPSHLEEAIGSFTKRHRRFGGLD